MKIMKLISSLGKGEELVLFSACVVKLHSLGRPLNRVPVRRIVRWGGRDYFTVAMSDENGFVKFDSLTVRQSFLSSIASSPVEQQLIVNYEKRDWMLWIAKKYDDYSVNGECNGKPLTFDSISRYRTSR